MEALLQIPGRQKLWFIVFAVFVFAIILGGVQNGIETNVKDHDAGSGNPGS